MVCKPFACIWGCAFESCDYVVTRTYYQKWGKGSHLCVSKLVQHNLHICTFGQTYQVSHDIGGSLCQRRPNLQTINRTWGYDICYFEKDD
jgi:hypothetical protein